MDYVFCGSRKQDGEVSPCARTSLRSTPSPRGAAPKTPQIASTFQKLLTLEKNRNLIYNELWFLRFLAVERATAFL